MVFVVTGFLTAFAQAAYVLIAFVLKAPFSTENIIYLLPNTCYLNEEIDCTEPSPIS
jgi:hypothetical protein